LTMLAEGPVYRKTLGGGLYREICGKAGKKRPPVVEGQIHFKSILPYLPAGEAL